LMTPTVAEKLVIIRVFPPADKVAILKNTVTKQPATFNNE